MVTLGFDNYVEPLKLYLHKYREVRLLLSVLRWKAIGQPQPRRSPFIDRLVRSLFQSTPTKRQPKREGESPDSPAMPIQQYQPAMYMNQVCRGPLVLRGRLLLLIACACLVPQYPMMGQVPHIQYSQDGSMQGGVPGGDAGGIDDDRS